MKTIDKTYQIKAPIDKVWQALTEANVIEQWTGDKAVFENKEGGDFSFWDGDIHGSNAKIVPCEYLEQNWYASSSPGQLFKVTFKLTHVDGITTVHLIHANIPDEDVEDFDDGWKVYYFDPIKQLLES